MSETREQRVQAIWSDKIQATVQSSRTLLYTGGAVVGEDVPAHVRAGSALAVTSDRVVVFQDDTNVVAVLDRKTETITPILLPRGSDGSRQFGGGRPNKKQKLDLEACVTLADQTVIAFGSGSTALRERVVVLSRDEIPGAELLALPSLYQAFRREKSFSGSELNIEGVARVGSKLRFFQRGNGAPVDGIMPLDATAELEIDCILALLKGEQCAIDLSNIVQYDLGKIYSVRATFTDAWSHGDEPVWFLASAEDSPDTYQDGVVMGSAIGCIFADKTTHIALIRQADGTPFCEKAEGLAMDPHDPTRAFVVVDKDDASKASELYEIKLTLTNGLHL